MEDQLKQLNILREELAAVRDQFTLKTMLLTRKIDALEKEFVASNARGTPKNNALNDTPTAKSATAVANYQQADSTGIEPIVRHSPKPATDSTSASSSVENTNAPEQRASSDIHSNNTQAHSPKPRKPRMIDVFFTQIMSLIFEWFSPVTTIYESYKARGMLGIFFLTVAGAGLVLAGFGYLMQLLIDEMGAGSKSLLMSATAVGVIGGGIALQIKSKFSEFASAIVALGLLLCFSTIYFVGSVYELIPGLPVLLLYAGTALSCHYLALWLDTKVIAVFGIVGITIMPLLSGSTIIEPTYYVLALLCVSASSLYLAYKYIGHWLADLTFAFTFLALGWIDAANAIAMSAWMINAFYLLFSAYLFIALFQHRPLTKRYLILQAALVGGTLLLLLQGNEYADFAAGYSATGINIQLLINAVIVSLLAVLFYKVKHEHITVMVLIAATWTVLSIIALLDATYWGIAWAVEALLLIFMSRYYNLPSLVHQGQGLAAIALSYCLFAVIPYFPAPALQSQDGWVIVLTILLLISSWQRIIKPSTASLANTDTDSNELTSRTGTHNHGRSKVQYSQYVYSNVYPFLVLAESVWLSIIAISCAYIWLGEWAGLSAIVVQIALLCRAKQVHSTRANKTSLEVLAVILILFPLAYVVMGSEAVNSMRFSMLPIYAKASLIIAFVQLWLWSAFYRKFNPQSSLIDIAERARILFYLILPICWLPATYRRLDDDILMLLWLSPAIAMLLAHFTKAKPLLLESRALFIGLTFMTLWLLLDKNLGISVIGLAGYLLVVALAYFLNNKTPSKNQFQFVNHWAINTTGIMLAMIVAFYFDSLLLPLFVITSCSMFVIGMNRRSVICHENRSFHLFYLAAVSIFSWLILLIGVSGGTVNSILFALVPVSILLSVFVLKKRDMLPLEKLFNSQNRLLELGMHSYLVVTYVLICLDLDNYNMSLAIAPLLAVHGATILFLKTRTKLTVRYSFALILLGIAKLALIDTANVVLWQKVMLFIGIGVFILFASFWYQKLVSKDAELFDETLSHEPMLEDTADQ